MTTIAMPKKRPRGRPRKDDRWTEDGQDPHEIRREALTRTAAREFSRQGFFNTSLDHLAELLNVTKPTLYHYVKDKDEILFECNRQALMMVLPTLEALAASSMTGLQKLAALAPVWARMTTSDFGICLLRTGIGPLKPESRAILEDHMRQLDDAVTAIVADGIRDGSIRACNPRLTAFAIISAFNGMSTWFNPQGTLSIEQVAEVFADLFARGLAPRG